MLLLCDVTGELGDDDDEIDEEGDMYLEKLKRMGKKIDGGGGGAGDEDSDDEWDEAEETALESYETPLDKINCPVDEYQIFKALLESESSSNVTMRHSLRPVVHRSRTSV